MAPLLLSSSVRAVRASVRSQCSKQGEGGEGLLLFAFDEEALFPTWFLREAALAGAEAEAEEEDAPMEACTDAP